MGPPLPLAGVHHEPSQHRLLLRWPLLLFPRQLQAALQRHHKCLPYPPATPGGHPAPPRPCSPAGWSLSPGLFGAGPGDPSPLLPSSAEQNEALDWPKVICPSVQLNPKAFPTWLVSPWLSGRRPPSTRGEMNEPPPPALWVPHAGLRLSAEGTDGCGRRAVTSQLLHPTWARETSRHLRGTGLRRPGSPSPRSRARPLPGPPP